MAEDKLSRFFQALEQTPLEAISLRSTIDAIKSHGPDALGGMSSNDLDNAVDMILEIAAGTLQQFHASGRDCGGLTVDQLAALQLYTTDITENGSMYSLVNHHLCDERHLPAFAPYIWLLLHAMKKCPVYSGTHVYRGVKLEGQSLRELVESYEPKSVHHWRRFTSTSALAGVRADFLGERHPSQEKTGIMFDIELEPGNILISAVSLISDEEEILLPPNFTFEVMSKAELIPGRLYNIQLREVVSSDPILHKDDGQQADNGRTNGITLASDLLTETFRSSQTEILLEQRSIRDTLQHSTSALLARIADSNDMLMRKLDSIKEGIQENNRTIQETARHQHLTTAQHEEAMLANQQLSEAVLQRWDSQHHNESLMCQSRQSQYSYLSHQIEEIIHDGNHVNGKRFGSLEYPSRIPGLMENNIIDKMQEIFVNRLHSLRDDDSCADTDNPQDGCVRGVFSGYWRLRGSVLEQLFEISPDLTVVRRSYPMGKGVRDVAIVTSSNGLSFHFKSNPEFPCHEIAVNQLSLILFGDAVMHDVLEVFMSGKWYLFTVSETVVGETLADELHWFDKTATEERKKELSGKLYRRISTYLPSFGRSCLMTMLCRLQDQKPDNVLIRHDGSLACIDNERAFVVDSCSNRKSEIQSVLFCMNVMNGPLHSKIVDSINSWGDESCGFGLVARWLNRLSDLDESIKLRFSNSKVMIALMPAIVWKIAIGITQIKRYACNGYTYRQLLEIVLPEASRSYSSRLSEDVSIQNRFEAASEYRDSNLTSRLTTTDVMLKLIIEKVGEVDGLEWVTPQDKLLPQAPSPLLNLVSHINGGLIDETLRILIDANINWLRLKVLLQSLHEMGLLDHVLDKVDFSRGSIAECANQKKFLDALKLFSHSSVILTKAMHVVESDLVGVLSKSQNLVCLTLRKCKRISSFSDRLKQRLVNVRLLRIEGMPLGAVLDVSKLTSLTRLELISLSGLKRIELNPNCAYLDLRGSWTPSMETIQLGQTIGLKRDNVIGVNRVDEIEICRVHSEVLQRNLDSLLALPTTHEMELVLKLLDWSLLSLESGNQLVDNLAKIAFHSVCFNSANHLTKNQILSILFGSVHVNKLISSNTREFPSVLLSLPRKLRYLEVLDISNCPFTTLALSDLDRVTERLKVLSLCNVGITSFDPVEPVYWGLLGIRALLPNLSYVDLSKCNLLNTVLIERNYDHFSLSGNNKFLRLKVNNCGVDCIMEILSRLTPENESNVQDVFDRLQLGDGNSLWIERVPKLLEFLRCDKPVIRRAAACIVGKFPEDAAYRNLIAAAVSSLAQLLNDDDVEVRRRTLTVIHTIANNGGYGYRIVSAAELCGPLVGLLNENAKDDEIRLKVLDILTEASGYEDGRSAIEEADSIPRLVELLLHANPSIQAKASVVLNPLLKNAKLDTMTTAVRCFAHHLSCDDAEVHRRTLTAIDIIVDKHYHRYRIIVAAGLCGPLVCLLTNSKGDELVLKVLDILTEASGCDNGRSAIEEADSIPRLVELLLHANPSIQAKASVVLNPLLKNAKLDTMTTAVRCFAHHLSYGDAEVHRRTLSAIDIIVDKHYNRYRIIAAAGLCAPLVGLLTNSTDVENRLKLLDILIAVAGKGGRSAIAETDAIPRLLELLLDDTNTSIQGKASTILILLLENGKCKTTITASLVQLLNDDDVEVRRRTLTVIYTIANNGGYGYRIVSAAELCGPLVGLLNENSKDDEIRLKVLDILTAVSAHEDGRSAIEEADSIPRLVELLLHASPSIQAKASVVLNPLLKNAKLKTMTAAVSCFAHHLSCDDAEVHRRTLTAIDTISDKRCYGYRIAVAAGLCRPLVDLLSDGSRSDELVLKVLDILTAVSGSEGGCSAIEEAHAIPRLIDLLLHANASVNAMASIVLSRLLENPQCKAVITAAIVSLGQQLNDENTEVIERTLQAIDAFADHGRRIIVAAGLCGPLVGLLNESSKDHHDGEIKLKILDILATVFGNKDSRNAVVETNAIPRLFQQLLGGNSNMAATVLNRHLENAKCKAMVASAVGSLAQQLNDDNVEARRRTLATIHTIATNDLCGYRILIAAGLCGPLVGLLNNSKDDEIRLEVLDILAIVSGNKDGRNAIVETDALPRLTELLLDDTNTSIQAKASCVLQNLEFEKKAS